MTHKPYFVFIWASMSEHKHPLSIDQSWHSVKCRGMRKCSVVVHLFLLVLGKHSTGFQVKLPLYWTNGDGVQIHGATEHDITLCTMCCGYYVPHNKGVTGLINFEYIIHNSAAVLLKVCTKCRTPHEQRWKKSNSDFLGVVK